MLVPVTLIGVAGSGLGAGPDTTEPSLSLVLLSLAGQRNPRLSHLLDMGTESLPARFTTLP